MLFKLSYLQTIIRCVQYINWIVKENERTNEPKKKQNLKKQRIKLYKQFFTLLRPKKGKRENFTSFSLYVSLSVSFSCWFLLNSLKIFFFVWLQSFFFFYLFACIQNIVYLILPVWFSLRRRKKKERTSIQYVQSLQLVS